MRIAWLGIIAACTLTAQTQAPKSLAEVQTIFVDSLGQTATSVLIRDKIINRLAASARFQVVLDGNKADAILTGSGTVSQGQTYTNGSGGTHYDASAAVRLVTRDQRILWVSETKNSLFARSATSSVADHIVKELLKAATPSKKK
jgi:hypothetical protein